MDLCTTDDAIVCDGAGLHCSSGPNNAETCDGVDNDCNPLTADGAHEPTLGAACDGTDPDACSDDTTVCSGSMLRCSAGVDNAELCDGNDNDCDPGSADGADDPQLNTQCDGADSDACPDDAYLCSGGGLTCSAGTNTLDMCDGLDNDCRTSTADGAHEPQLGQPCNSSADTDNCLNDTWVCGAGLVCPSSGPSIQDVCDGADNDCNAGTADGSAEPTLGQPCDGPADADACTDGVWTCGGGSGMVCNDAATSPSCVDVDVGTFTQTPNGSGVQVIPHSLSTTPRFLIVWSTGSTGPATGGYLASIGYVDQNRNQRASAATRQAGSFRTARYIGNKAIVVVSGTGTVIADATVSAWTATNFTLTWNTTSTSGRTFQFLAVSGPEVRSLLKTWLMPTTAVTSTQGSLGFTPTGVLHLSSGYSFTATPPAADTTAHLGISGTDGTGQFTAHFKALDNDNPTATSRFMQSTRCFIGWTPSFTYDLEATCNGGLSANAFAVNFVNPPPEAGQVSSLALGGVRVKTACFDKPTATGTPFNHDVTGVGFAPKAVLIATNNTDIAAGPVTIASFSLGASTGGEDFASALIDENGTSSPDAISWANSGASYLRYDTAGTQVSSAEISSMLAGGFRLRFTTNTASTADICYMAFGAP